jgi:hypothetical protein
LMAMPSFMSATFSKTSRITITGIPIPISQPPPPRSPRLIRPQTPSKRCLVKR